MPIDANEVREKWPDRIDADDNLVLLVTEAGVHSISVQGFVDRFGDVEPTLGSLSQHPNTTGRWTDYLQALFSSILVAF